MQQKIAVAKGRAKANIVLKNAYVMNVFTEQFITADVAICNNTIVGVGDYHGEYEVDCSGRYLVPGYIDAKAQMAWSGLLPDQLSSVLLHAGTTTVIADPHAVTERCRQEGLDWFLDLCDHLPLDVYATCPPTLLASLLAEESPENLDLLQQYLSHPRVVGISNLSDASGLIHGYDVALQQLLLHAALPVGGYTTQLIAAHPQACRVAGITSTDDCVQPKHAIDLLQAGVSLFLNTGKTTGNVFPILKALIQDNLPLEQCHFCTGHQTLSQLQRGGHIASCIKQAISLGVRPITAYKMASYYTAKLFHLTHLGAIAPGYQADILVLDKLEDATPSLVFKNGLLVCDSYLSAFDRPQIPAFLQPPKPSKRLQKADLALPVEEYADVIELTDSPFFTQHLYEQIPTQEGEFLPNHTHNKVCVIQSTEEYNQLCIAPLKGFGIEHGAIATTLSCDGSSTIAVGDNDNDLVAALDCVRDLKGGIAVVSAGHLCASLSLPFGGMMSNKSVRQTADRFTSVLRALHAMGVSEQTDPFLSLGLLPHLAFPEIRLTAGGLYDSLERQWISKTLPPVQPMMEDLLTETDPLSEDNDQ